jgi:hypothetical protein
MSWWLTDLYPWTNSYPHHCLTPELKSGATIQTTSRSLTELYPWTNQSLVFCVVYFRLLFVLLLRIVASGYSFGIFNYFLFKSGATIQTTSGSLTDLYPWTNSYPCHCLTLELKSGATIQTRSESLTDLYPWTNSYPHHCLTLEVWVWVCSRI